MSRYETLEDNIVALFNVPLTQQEIFDIAPLPENEVEYKPSQPRPQVYVSYDSSDFTDTETLSKVVQEEKLLIGFEIHSKVRRGEKGVFAIFETICKKLLGKKILGYDKFTLIKSGPLPGAGANHWVYYAQFTTTSHITDQQPDPDYTTDILTNPQFIVPGENTSPQLLKIESSIGGDSFVFTFNKQMNLPGPRYFDYFTFNYNDNSNWLTQEEIDLITFSVAGNKITMLFVNPCFSLNDTMIISILQGDYGATDGTVFEGVINFPVTNLTQ
ncbi:MAG: Gp37 family protein [Bacteroidales bacterium]